MRREESEPLAPEAMSLDKPLRVDLFDAHMLWIAPSEQNTAAAAVEKRLRAAANSTAC